MHVVTSFDFGGTSNVKLHVVTDDLGLAQEVYASVLELCNQNNMSNTDTATKMMVELTHVTKDTKLLGAEALTLFWGSGDNNNK
jgi:hypothetical protein